MNDAPPLPRSRRALALAALALATVAGGAWLSFLCDDAFITFRYVANARDGHGLVWNAPPFAPVEGYTSFLWALVLWAAWEWLGVAPPDAANPLSILCGLGQLAVVAWAALSLRGRDGARLPDAVGLVAAAVVVCNRTFLQWTTSGLETALFDLGFVAWVVWAFRRERTAGWLAGWSALAALVALTRPDGLLLVGATGAVATVDLARRRRGPGATVLGLAPLVLVAVHVGWRRWFYGEWLPNTYYAKIVAAWPEAGLCYLASFVVEHGTWVVALVALLWLVAELGRGPRAFARLALDRLAATAAVGAVLAHAAYYTLVVGGDHFEYRVFSHLVPLCTLAVAAMAARIARGRAAPIGATLALGVASSVGWLQLALTHDLPSHGFRPVAPRLPAAFAPLAPLARAYDRQQAWLLFHNIGLRCRHHARLLERFRQPFPDRLPIPDPPGPNPVFSTGAVGAVGWCLPDAAIVDQHGLNDWVVARTPLRAFGPPLDRDALRPLLVAANADGDDWLVEAELRQALALLSGGDGQGEAADFLVRVMLAIHARTRPDAMTLAEAEGIGDMLSRARSMAHERHPPDGYVADFAPNVVVEGGVATALPREVPLTDDRVRALEAKWRAWITRQR